MLTPQQFAIMKDPATRKRFPGNVGDFNFFDQMLRENGEGCPRLAAIWEKVFAPADAKAWLKTATPGKPTPVVVPQGRPVPNIVKRAMNVLNSYKKP